MQGRVCNGFIQSRRRLRLSDASGLRLGVRGKRPQSWHATKSPTQLSCQPSQRPALETDTTHRPQTGWVSTGGEGSVLWTPCQDSLAEPLEYGQYDAIAAYRGSGISRKETLSACAVMEHRHVEHPLTEIFRAKTHGAYKLDCTRCKAT